MVDDDLLDPVEFGQWFEKTRLHQGLSLYQVFAKLKKRYRTNHCSWVRQDMQELVDGRHGWNVDRNICADIAMALGVTPECAEEMLTIYPNPQRYEAVLATREKYK